MSKNNNITICLNMIVKDESHIIIDTLTKLLKKIDIDYWVICDTGSSDNTIELILCFFKEKNIKGELYNDKWVDFAYNRSLALSRAYNKTDLLFVFDADDEIDGEINIRNHYNPKIDGYFLKFGNEIMTYQRILLINNRIKWLFKSVLHEYIECIEKKNCVYTILEGDYFVKSGRTGSRNKDEKKYLKDALLLEEAYKEAKSKDDKLFFRYSYYCANSYRDNKSYEDALKWYINTLELDYHSPEEKYNCCLNIQLCYNLLTKNNLGVYYAFESLKYCKMRCECWFELIVMLYNSKEYKSAWNTYCNIKDFYEILDEREKYSKFSLFYNSFQNDFYFPTLILQLCDKLLELRNDDYNTSVYISTMNIMFMNIFTQSKNSGLMKIVINENENIHLLDNVMTIFVNNYEMIEGINSNIKSVFVEFLNNTIENNLTYENKYYLLNFMHTNKIKCDRLMNILQKKIEENECKMIDLNNNCRKSKNLLLIMNYTAEPINLSYMNNNALGGSETIMIQTFLKLSKDYNIYITGNVKCETIEENNKIYFIEISEFLKLIERESIYFYAVVVVRDMTYLDLCGKILSRKCIISLHDLGLMNEIDKNNFFIINKYYISRFICVTNWHKKHLIMNYNYIFGEQNLRVIENGVDLDLISKVKEVKNKSDFNNSKKLDSMNIYIRGILDLYKIQLDDMSVSSSNKIKNSFIFTSRSERGLLNILSIWVELEKIHKDISLFICHYENFPRNNSDELLLEIIKSHKNIYLVGKLNKKALYELMNICEYWFFPSDYPETFCITALEMLMNEVICLYYPNAGLGEIMNNESIKLEKGKELATLLDVMKYDDIAKNAIINRGLEIAQKYSLDNIYTKWTKLLSELYDEDKCCNNDTCDDKLKYAYVSCLDKMSLDVEKQEQYNVNMSSQINILIIILFDNKEYLDKDKYFLILKSLEYLVPNIDDIKYLFLGTNNNKIDEICFDKTNVLFDKIIINSNNEDIFNNIKVNNFINTQDFTFEENKDDIHSSLKSLYYGYKHSKFSKDHSIKSVIYLRVDDIDIDFDNKHRIVDSVNEIVISLKKELVCKRDKGYIKMIGLDIELFKFLFSDIN